MFIVRICICLNEISKTCMKCANRTFANAIERKRFWDDLVPYSCRFRTYIHISLIARLDRQTKQFLTLHKQAFAVNGSTKHIFSSTLEEEEEVQMYFQARLTWSVLSYFIPKYWNNHRLVKRQPMLYLDRGQNNTHVNIRAHASLQI